MSIVIIDDNPLEEIMLSIITIDRELCYSRMPPPRSHWAQGLGRGGTWVVLLKFFPPSHPSGAPRCVSGSQMCFWALASLCDEGCGSRMMYAQRLCDRRRLCYRRQCVVLRTVRLGEQRRWSKRRWSHECSCKVSRIVANVMCKRFPRTKEGMSIVIIDIYIYILNYNFW